MNTFYSGKKLIEKLLNSIKKKKIPPETAPGVKKGKDCKHKSVGPKRKQQNPVTFPAGVVLCTNCSSRNPEGGFISRMEQPGSL